MLQPGGAENKMGNLIIFFFPMYMYMYMKDTLEKL